MTGTRSWVDLSHDTKRIVVVASDRTERCPSSSHVLQSFRRKSGKTTSLGVSYGKDGLNVDVHHLLVISIILTRPAFAVVHLGAFVARGGD